MQATYASPLKLNGEQHNARIMQRPQRLLDPVVNPIDLPWLKIGA
jgi:hypothetical protein